MRSFYLKFSITCFVVAGVILAACGIVKLCMPKLDGVEKGVTIKVRQDGKRAVKRFVSPGSDGFVFSDRLPKYVAGAIITSEDEDFYTHNGISINEIFEAAQYDLRHLSLKCGGSTITQQFVKNVYLSGEKTFRRKIIEAFTAVSLEKKLSKKQILDYYINIVEFGDGIYGIRQASYIYFNKSPEELTPREAATLAVLMPRPKIRGRALLAQNDSKFQKRRVKHLLARMKEQGYLRGV